MNLDALKAQWATLDAKLELSLRLNRRLLAESCLRKTRSALWRFALSLGLELLAATSAVVGLGMFIYDNARAPGFALPAVGLDAYAIAILVFVARQIGFALGVDYSQPVAVIQRELETLRRLRVRSLQWALLLAPLAWALFVIVGPQAFFGVDAYEALGPTYLAANFVFGLAFIPLVLWLTRKYGEHLGRFPGMQRLLRDLAGYNLNIATNFLTALSEFEERV